MGASANNYATTTQAILYRNLAYFVLVSVVKKIEMTTPVGQALTKL